MREKLLKGACHTTRITRHGEATLEANKNREKEGRVGAHEERRRGGEEEGRRSRGGKG